MDKKKIAIVGATGYTGSELVRLLLNHPDVKIDLITSETHAGNKLSSVHPFLEHIEDHNLVSVDQLEDRSIDLVFLALPHGVSMDYVKRFKNQSFKIIDLSGDFRLSSSEVYSEWYKTEHTYPKGFHEAVYGLPELFSDHIRKATLVANPGCFPTAAILGIAPLLSAGLVVPEPIIVDSKTGVTGAGVKSKPVNLFSNVNDNFKAYGLKTHRHTIEMEEILSALSSDKNSTIQFTPHLLPVDRGIFSTIYLKPKKAVSEHGIRSEFKRYYNDKLFVRLRSQIPAIKDVRGTNYCDLFTTYDERTGLIIVISVIDNLVKGAAGQAIQNMNLMLGLNESAGLNQIPLNP